MQNPLFNTDTKLPDFPAIKPEHVLPAIEKLIEEINSTLANLMNNNTQYDWQTLLAPLEEAEDKLEKAWAPVRHLNSVMNSEALRSVYDDAIVKLADFQTALGQNHHLYQAYQKIAESQQFEELTPAQQTAIHHGIRDFKLAGVALSDSDKVRYGELQRALSKLSSEFSNNVLDATQAWTYQTDDQQKLAGIPKTTLDAAAANAQSQGLTGWLLTLEYPDYHAVMTYAEDRILREKFYHAYCTRASDQGPTGGQWDNSNNIIEQLALKQELAELLSFSNYAELSLATKMAETPEQVIDFLTELAEKSLPQAQTEYDELSEFAKSAGCQDFSAWDVAFYSEKLREQKYAISQEALRPYFPVNTVLAGMFNIVERLYGIQFRENRDIKCWHDDVKFFDVIDEAGQSRGGFYLDIYARSDKRGGAWMDECVVRRCRQDNSVQNPVAFLTCNFNGPVGGNPALLTHDEVVTLFHEFGHGLHHLLTQVDIAAVSGINGVPWDAVELPSQFFENWCWEPEAIKLISCHYETGETLPDLEIDKLQAAKHFQSAMFMVRQLEFALFDFQLHREYPDLVAAKSNNVITSDDVQQLLNQIRQQVAVVQPPSFNRFQHSFSHIFAGGYAAGYYSYKWAEVLAADAFGLFLEQGLFDRESGRKFLHTFLEQGGVREPMSLYIDFRGRKPTIDALLIQSGIRK